MLLLWLSFDRRESDLSRPLLLAVRGSSAEEELVEVDANEDLVWMRSCEDLRAIWLRARTAASSA